MTKKILYFLAVLIIIQIGFTFYLSPSFIGLIPGGKDSHDMTVQSINFENAGSDKYHIDYPDRQNEERFVKLREAFRLDTIVSEFSTDFNKVLAIQSWVQSQWVHDGDSPSEKRDAYYILTEAQKGRRFRCVEYSLVASECLLSLGFKVRGLGLMTKDINEVNYGAGHVLNEVYLEDLNKWIMIDPQFDVIVSLNDVPLNAVELQNAIINEEDIRMYNPNQVISKENYIRWIGPYLYYFTTSLNIGGVEVWDRIVGNKKQLTLVPLEADNPKYFQRLFRINTSYFTHSVTDFYPVP